MRIAKKLFKVGSKNFNVLGKTMMRNRSLLARTFMCTTLTAGGIKLFMKDRKLNEIIFAEASDEFQTINIGLPGDFIDGKLSEVQIGDDKENDIIIVTRVNGKLYACGAKCSHFGAPLSKGMFFEDRVYCPWHLASFSVITGYPDNGPMMDGIPTYKIWEEEGKVFVEAPKKVTKIRSPVPMVVRDPENKARYVIVGGGVAAGSAAETLRQAGFTGEILMISGEDALPYDRTLLTKGDGPMLKMPVDKMFFRQRDFLQKIGVTVQTGKMVVDVDPVKKTLQTDDGKSLSYDKLLIASGASAKVPPVKGVNLANVFTLRDFSDVQQIRNNFEGVKNVVVVGASFTGVEAASSIKTALGDQGHVTVVTQGSEAYERSLGAAVGNSMRLWTEKHGLTYQFGSPISELQGDKDGRVSKVVLSNGNSFDADLVILATGVQPNTWFLKNRIALDSDGGVNADVFMRSTTDKDIFAAGDVVSFPYFHTAERIRVEHISEAIGTGAFAAMNMTGKMVPYNGVPFFWTRAFNKSLAYVGNASSYDEVSPLLNPIRSLSTETHQSSTSPPTTSSKTESSPRLVCSEDKTSSC